MLLVACNVRQIMALHKLFFDAAVKQILYQKSTDDSLEYKPSNVYNVQLVVHFLNKLFN